MPVTKPSLHSEIFAPDPTIYEVETTRQPYYDKTDTEIERLVCRFPLIRRRWC
jgi:hypothetical protein